MDMRFRKADDENPENLTEQLKDVIDLNVKEDGELDEYDTPDFLGQDSDEEDDYGSNDDDTTPLDYDFDEDDELYEDMRPADPVWPQHDFSCLWPYSAINRYMSDYLSMVARVERVAKVLSTVKSRKL